MDWADVQCSFVRRGNKKINKAHLVFDAALTLYTIGRGPSHQLHIAQFKLFLTEKCLSRIQISLGKGRGEKEREKKLSLQNIRQKKLQAQMPSSGLKLRLSISM